MRLTLAVTGDGGQCGTYSHHRFSLRFTDIARSVLSGYTQVPHDLEQTLDVAVFVEVDSVCRRHTGQPRHGHDLAGNGDNELRTGR